MVSGGDDHGIKIWELQRGKCIKTFQGNSNAVYAITHGQHNLLASAHEDQTIKLWNINLNSPQDLSSDLQPSQVLRGHSDRVLSIAFSPNVQILASASADRTIRLWNPHTGKALKTLLGHKSWIWGIAFSPNGQFLASGSYDHTVKVWHIESGECLQNWVSSLSLSQDAQTLLSASWDETIKCWDIATTECWQTLRVPMKA